MPSRLLKKSASSVLTALRGSTSEQNYASPLRLLRPCWTAFLNSLQVIVILYVTVIVVGSCRPAARLTSARPVTDSDGRRRKKTSAPGTSTSRRTEKDCRLAGEP